MIKLIITILDRIIFVFPTLLYAASILSRALAGSGLFSADEDDNSTRKIEVQFLIDGALLGVINGFIIIFGIGQTGYGILLSFTTLALSLLGISSLYSGSSSYTSLFIIVLNIILFGQFLDLATFSFPVSIGVIIGLAILLFVYLVRFADSEDELGEPNP